MAIQMVGGVYCPLSPRDPEHRLQALVQQTQCRLVLVHWLTKTKFNDDIVSLDIDSILINNVMKMDVYIDRLSNVVVIPDNIAYIIFTSGSTGIPKAVCMQYFRKYLLHFCALL
jgi:non-ribosomal peptide synthetase component F